MRISLRPGVLLICLLATPLLAQDLPSAEDVLRHVIQRATRHREFENPSYYLCTKRTLKEEMDAEGNVTQRKERIGANRSQVTGTADADNWSNQNGFQLNEPLLERYHFTVEARETLNGRAALRLRFEPKDPPVPVRQFQDRLLNQTMGTVWVDEKEHELAKAILWLRTPVSFGILGAVEMFQFGFQRWRAEDGNWLTQWTDTHVKARKFIRHIQTHKRVDWSDFKRTSGPLPAD